MTVEFVTRNSGRGWTSLIPCAVERMLSVVLSEHAFKLRKTLVERNLPIQVLPTEGNIQQRGACERRKVTLRVNLRDIAMK